LISTYAKRMVAFLIMSSTSYGVRMYKDI